jgi:hypothetical protein
VDLAERFLGMMERPTPRERELFGFPAVGDPYWNDQTLTDVPCHSGAAAFPNPDRS